MGGVNVKLAIRENPFNPCHPCSNYCVAKRHKALALQIIFVAILSYSDPKTSKIHVFIPLWRLPRP